MRWSDRSPLLLACLLAALTPALAQAPQPPATAGQQVVTELSRRLDQIEANLRERLSGSRLQALASELANLLELLTGQLADVEERLAAAAREQEPLTARRAGIAAELDSVNRQLEAAADDATVTVPAELPGRKTELEREAGDLAETLTRLEERTTRLDAQRRDLLQAQGRARELAADAEALLPAAQVADQLDELAEAVDLEAADVQALNEQSAALEKLRDESRSAAAAATAALAEAEEQLASLGEPSADGSESAEMSGKRVSLQRQTARLERVRSDHQFNLLRATERLEEISRLQPSTAAASLLRRQASLPGLVWANLAAGGQWLEFGRRLVAEGSGLDRFTPLTAALAAVALVLAWLLGGWLRQRCQTWSASASADGLGQRLVKAGAASLAVHARWLLVLGTVSALLNWVTAASGSATEAAPVSSTLANSLLLYLLFRSALRSVLAPYEPAVEVVELPPRVALGLARSLAVVALMLVLGLFLFRTMREFGLSDEPYQLVRGLYLAILSLSVARTLWLEQKLTDGSAYWRKLAVGLLVAAVALEVIGYHQLAGWLVRSLLITLFFVLVYGLVLRLADELVGALNSGGLRWTRWLREQLRLEDDQPFPGLSWLRFTVKLMLYWNAALLLLVLWADGAGYLAAVSRLKGELKVGGLEFSLAEVVVGLSLFGLVMTVQSWVVLAVDRYLEARTEVDPGGRAAARTIATYVGWAVAALIGLGTMGLNLTNLTVVAGALSVGIGFGLQNIVDNFVSGLILLFERPIKPGDWVKIGDTEGYVKRLSVRATEIQTFDRADVVVPNSDVLSQHVVNRTRHDALGRVEVAVGVAYGSDTAKVKAILLEVAEANREQVPIKGFPAVLFMGFGDSSLDFELRVIVADVDRRLGVASDLRFEIDRRFREEGIEIPFPQQDVWFRNAVAAGEKEPPTDREPPTSTDG